MLKFKNPTPKIKRNYHLKKLSIKLRYHIYLRIIQKSKTIFFQEIPIFLIEKMQHKQLKFFQ